MARGYPNDPQPCIMRMLTLKDVTTEGVLLVMLAIFFRLNRHHRFHSSSQRHTTKLVILLFLDVFTFSAKCIAKLI